MPLWDSLLSTMFDLAANGARVEPAGRVLARQVALGDGVALASSLDLHRVEVAGRTHEVRERARSDFADERVDEDLQVGLRPDVDTGYPGGRGLARRGGLARDEQAVRPELVGSLRRPGLPRRRRPPARRTKGQTSVNKPSEADSERVRDEPEARHDAETSASPASQTPRRGRNADSRHR